jgi:hypothetical protein
VLSGIICIVAGLGAVLEASRYTIGSLSRLGPGFYPAVLVALLALVGLMITVTALAFAPVPDDAELLLAGGAELAGGPDWRGGSVSSPGGRCSSSSPG